MADEKLPVTMLLGGPKNTNEQIEGRTQITN